MTESTPICRCRVLYLGSSVPQQTKDGLQGIQEPLQELYPDQGATGARGIDSWLSVWSNGILLENVDENHKKITRFFPIESLHYCAAVRYVLIPEKAHLHSPTPRFLPLDSPFARHPNPQHPPLFAAILRRTAGIKVLECHAFICKREVAANALVRCCFHAYADSSYARQVDVAGSVYGTLASGRGGSKERLDSEPWKPLPPRSQSASTSTLNTLNGTKDDGLSIYNGDENHKVWAGSQDNLDGIYDIYSSGASTMSRRPRQLTQPVAVPPPPPPPIKEKSGKKKGKRGGEVNGEEWNGIVMNGKANSVTSNHHHPHASPPMQAPLYIYPHPGTLPNPRLIKTNPHSNTFRRGGVARQYLVPVAPPTVPPMAWMYPPPPTTLTKSKKKGKQVPIVDEPIYVPANRALSAMGGYAPPIVGGYATMESQRGGKKKDKEKAKLNKKLAQSMNGLDDPSLLGPEESPFNTGIYRKKGHLNERAFSYSIRQEHRSRSYGSLANLKFASPIPNGVHDVDENSREDLKKEREIMQLVQDLDLSGDELERREVPRGMYESRAGLHHHGPIVVNAGPVQVNGRAHRR